MSPKQKANLNSWNTSLVAASRSCLSKATVSATVNALIDTGSSDSFILDATVKSLKTRKYHDK